MSCGNIADSAILTQLDTRIYPAVPHGTTHT
jgi:hypothetical protein